MDYTINSIIIILETFLQQIKNQISSKDIKEKMNIMFVYLFIRNRTIKIYFVDQIWFIIFLNSRIKIHNLN